MAQDPESSGLTPHNSGDIEVYNLLYDKYYHKLLVFIVGLGIPIYDAKDILNDIFLKLWENPVTFETMTHIPGYLYLAARNRRINYLRNLKHHFSTEDEHLQEIESPDNLPDELNSKLILQQLEGLLSQLPPQAAYVTRLSIFKELEVNEIASMLGVTPSAVRQHKRLGMQRLLEALEKNRLLPLLLALSMNLNFFK